MTEKSEVVSFWNGHYKDGNLPWDQGGVPERLKSFMQSPCIDTSSLSSKRILVPGCGSAYEVGYFAEKGLKVSAIDISEVAVKKALEVVSSTEVDLQVSDYFEYEAIPFDYIYERAFLCSFPPYLRGRFISKTRSLLKPGGKLFGFFFVDKERSKGPPYPIEKANLEELFCPEFKLLQDEKNLEQLTVFGGCERWQVWNFG